MNAKIVYLGASGVVLKVSDSLVQISVFASLIFQMRLNLDKHLTMKIGDKSLTQRFDVTMRSFLSDKNKIETVVLFIFSAGR